MNHQRRVALILALLPLLLAGCSGGGAPTDADVTHAVTVLLHAQGATFGGAQAAAKVTHVKTYDCNPAPDHRGYLCETSIAFAPPAPSLQRLVRMVNTPHGWQATMQ